MKSAGSKDKGNSTSFRFLIEMDEFGVDLFLKNGYDQVEILFRPFFVFTVDP